MKYLVKLSCLLFLIHSADTVQAQDDKQVKISGIVVSVDSLEPVSFTTIIIKNTSRGTVTDNSGYFSFLANELDTVEFSNVGFKKATFVVPSNLPEENYGLVQVMEKDTVLLREIEILAFPTAEHFQRAVLEIKPKKNLEDRTIQAQNEIHQALEEEMAQNQFYYDQMRYSKLYNLTGIARPNNYLNPITWSNFIKDWKEGKFKGKGGNLPGFDDN